MRNSHRQCPVDHLSANGLVLAVYTKEFANTATRENPIHFCNEAAGVKQYSSTQDGPLSVDLFQKIEKQMGHIDFLIHDLGAGTLSLEQGHGVSKGHLMQENLREAEALADFLQSRETLTSPRRLIFLAPWHWDQFADAIRYQTTRQHHCVDPIFIE